MCYYLIKNFVYVRYIVKHLHSRPRSIILPDQFISLIKEVVGLTEIRQKRMEIRPNGPVSLQSITDGKHSLGGASALSSAHKYL